MMILAGYTEIFASCMSGSVIFHGRTSNPDEEWIEKLQERNLSFLNAPLRRSTRSLDGWRKGYDAVDATACFVVRDYGGFVGIKETAA